MPDATAPTAATALGAPVRVIAVLEPLPAYAYGLEVLPYDGGLEEERRQTLRAAVAGEGSHRLLDRVPVGGRALDVHRGARRGHRVDKHEVHRGWVPSGRTPSRA